MAAMPFCCFFSVQLARSRLASTTIFREFCTKGLFLWSHKRMQVSIRRRTNLIRQHVDYHKLPVLPMPIHRRVYIDYSTIGGRVLRGYSENSGGVKVPLNEELKMNRGRRLVQPTVRQEWCSPVVEFAPLRGTSVPIPNSRHSTIGHSLTTLERLARMAPAAGALHV